jgi:hypothetical protein
LSIKLVWKRPDGYLGAKPEDFRILSISGHSNLWVHKTDRDTFPFRLSGDWANEHLSKRLNNLVNLLDDTDDTWRRYIEKISDDFEHEEDFSKVIGGLLSWVEELKKVFKGSSWESDIVANTLNAVQTRLQKICH